MTLANLLVIKFSHDRLLSPLRALASSSDSLFMPTIEKSLTLKASAMTDLISSQIHERLRDRHEVFSLLETQPVVGVKRNFSQTEILESLDESLKRVKRYEEQTDKLKKMVAIGFSNTQEFQKALDEYKEKRGQGVPVDIIPEEELKEEEFNEEECVKESQRGEQMDEVQQKMAAEEGGEDEQEEM